MSAPEHSSASQINQNVNLTFLIEKKKKNKYNLYLKRANLWPSKPSYKESLFEMSESVAL